MIRRDPTRRDTTRQAMFNEEIWEEPEHLLDPNDIYGSDKMYANSKSFQVYYRQESRSAFGLNLRQGALVDAGRLLLLGHSFGYVSKRTGVCRASLRKLFCIVSAQKYQIDKTEILCDCSKRPNHGGRCLFRSKRNFSPEVIIKFGCAVIKNVNVNILECGCFVDKTLGAILVECGTEECIAI